MAFFFTIARKLRLSLCFALALTIGFTPALPGARKPGHDRLVEALDLLKQAKDSPSAITLLFQAKDEVDGTLVPHKEVEHDKAVQAITDAINTAGRKENPDKAIDKAMAAVRALAGLGNGGGKKKK